MNGQHLLVYVILTVAVVFLARFAWRSFKAPRGCHCDQAGKADRVGLKRTPLIQLGHGKGRENDSAEPRDRTTTDSNVGPTSSG